MKTDYKALEYFKDKQGDFVITLPRINLTMLYTAPDDLSAWTSARCWQTDDNGYSLDNINKENYDFLLIYQQGRCTEIQFGENFVVHNDHSPNALSELSEQVNTGYEFINRAVYAFFLANKKNGDDISFYYGRIDEWQPGYDGSDDFPLTDKEWEENSEFMEIKKYND
jgi:hypothetical protein